MIQPNLKTQSPNYRSIIQSVGYLNKQTKYKVLVLWLNVHNCKIIYSDQYTNTVSVSDPRLLEAAVADRLSAITDQIAKIKFARWERDNAKQPA